MKRETFDRLLERICRDYRVPGCLLTIHKNREILYQGTCGVSDREQKTPLKMDDLFWLYSMSKVYTCTLVMKLIDQGKIDLEAPVSEYLPEYSELYLRETGEKCKNTLLVRHLMTMTGGMDYLLDTDCLNAYKEKTGGKASTREVVRVLAENGLVFEPGTHFLYSLCHDVLGGVIESVTGKSFGQALQSELLEPLGIRHLGFFPDDKEKERIVEQYMNGPVMTPVGKENTLKLSDCHESGGAGLFASAEEYIKLADMLACGGLTEDGTRLVSEQSIREMSRNHLNEICMADLQNSFQNHGLEAFGYGLGVRAKIKEDGTSPVGEFGWDGAAGGYVLIDPVNHLTVCYLQSVLNHGEVYAEIHPMIRETVYREMRNEF